MFKGFSVKRSVFLQFDLLFFLVMASIQRVIQKFQDEIGSTFNLQFSDERPTFGRPGVANRLFIIHLAQDKKLFF